MELLITIIITNKYLYLNLFFEKSINKLIY